MNIERVAIVSDGPLARQDGVQRYCATVGEWLASQAIEVHYFTSGSGASYEAYGGTVHHIAHPMSIRSNGNEFGAAIIPSSNDGLDLVRDGYFDVIHTQLPDGPFVGARVARSARLSHTSIMGTYHLMPFSLGNERLLRIAGILSSGRQSQIHHIVATSRLVADFAERMTGLSCDVLLPPVAVGFPTESSREREPTVTYVGRLSKRKGVSVLLRAYERLGSELHRTVPLNIVGDGPERRSLQRLTQTLGIADAVQFLGRLTDEQVVQQWQSASVAVFPAVDGESFGLVLVEAMRSGVPVVAAANRGYASTMSGLDDQLVRPGDPDALAEKIQSILFEDELARRSRLQRQFEVANKFAVSEVGPKIIDAYLKTITLSRAA